MSHTREVEDGSGEGAVLSGFFCRGADGPCPLAAATLSPHVLVCQAVGEVALTVAQVADALKIGHGAVRSQREAVQ